MPKRPTLRKREIAFAVAMGIAGAGGAALLLDASDESGRRPTESAQAARTSFQVGPFEKIASLGPQRIVVMVGSGHSVRVQGPAEAVGRLEAVVENGTLTIRPRAGFDRRNWSRLDSAVFFVTLPRLEAASLVGPGDVRIDRIEGAAFSGTVDGSGALRIGDLRVDTAELTIRGSGDIVAAGTARETRVAMLGSGDIDARRLQSQRAEVSIVGSGDVALWADREARVSMLGSGDVDIEGTAQCSVARVGSGDVSCEAGSNE